jgi:hypothetical protein
MRCNWRELKSYLDQSIENRSILAVKNIDRYRQPDGSISAHIVRFENLAWRSSAVHQQLGLEYRSRFPHAKKGILTKGLDPRDLLNERQIGVINEIFAEEFETFHYQPLQ